jgi:hypothetical protein
VAMGEEEVYLSHIPPPFPFLSLLQLTSNFHSAFKMLAETRLRFGACLLSLFFFLGFTASLPVLESPPTSSPLLSRQSASAPPGVDVVAETDKWLFSTPISTFLSALASKTPPYLFWPSPGAKACSWGHDHPWDFDFKYSCQRHDFGYKNYRDQNRFCEAGRKKIDDQFSRDLRSYCAGRKWWKRPLCYTTAAGYIAGVTVNMPGYSRECYPSDQGGVGGTGRDPLGRCLPGKKCT